MGNNKSTYPIEAKRAVSLLSLYCKKLSLPNASATAQNLAEESIRNWAVPTMAKMLVAAEHCGLVKESGTFAGSRTYKLTDKGKAYMEPFNQPALT